MQEDKGTRSVVLVHAVRSSRSMYKPQIKRLKKAGFEVFAPNLPGHGDRTGENFSLDTAMDTISKAVSSCSEPPVLVGVSLGGFVSMHYAAHHGDTLHSVVLAGCTVKPGPFLARMYGAWLLAKDVLPGNSDARVYRSFAKANSPKAAKRYYGGGRARGVVRSVVISIGSLDVLDLVGRIPVPVTFVNGEHDAFRRHENAFVAAARDAQLRVLDRAGHISNLNRPGRFTRIIRDSASGIAPRLEA